MLIASPPYGRPFLVSLTSKVSGPRRFTWAIESQALGLLLQGLFGSNEHARQMGGVDEKVRDA